MKWKWACLSWAWLLVCAGPIFAQDAIPSAAPPSFDTASPTPAAADSTTPSTTACCQVLNGTAVEIEIAEAISSRLRKRGEHFQLRLGEPLVVDGRVLLPAGTAGTGEVIHAAPSTGGGKAGELILTARFLESGGQQIPLRGFRMGAVGKDRSDTALVASIALGPFAQFIHGREIEIPSGARANAKIAQDLFLAPFDVPPTPQE
jgi:hypothetical protein